MMPKLPFDEFEIKRGQSRGNKASLFSFSRPKTDETGNISTVKVVGKFKGKINMLNHEVLENFETVQAERLDLVIKMMREVYFLRTNEELDFDMEKLKTPEQRQKLIVDMRKGGLAKTGIATYILETMFEQKIARMLMTESKCLVRVYILEGF